MSPQQIRHCAQVALYTKFHAVRLMQAGHDAADLAAIFLDLFYAREFVRESLATPQDVEDLLVLVASGYDPGWSRRVQRNPPVAGAFDPGPALFDLPKTIWLWRIVDQLRADRPRVAAAEAFRYLSLRERIHSMYRPSTVRRTHGAELVRTLSRLISNQPQHIERNQSYDRPHFAPRRRNARWPRFRGLGF